MRVKERVKELLSNIILWTCSARQASCMLHNMQYLGKNYIHANISAEIYLFVWLMILFTTLFLLLMKKFDWFLDHVQYCKSHYTFNCMQAGSDFDRYWNYFDSKWSSLIQTIDIVPIHLTLLSLNQVAVTVNVTLILLSEEQWPFMIGHAWLLKENENVAIELKPQ